MKDLLLENGSYKVVALLITLILWVTVLGSKDLTIYKSVKLDIVLPPNYIVANNVADQAQLQISGSRLSLKKINKGLNPVTINLKDAHAGRTVVSVPTDEVGLPFGSKIISVNPASIVVDVDKVITKWLPVKIDWVTEEKPQRSLKAVSIRPSGVQVKGASSVLNRIDAVWTEPINVSEINFEAGKKSIEIRTQVKELSVAGLLPLEDRQIVIQAQGR